MPTLRPKYVLYSYMDLLGLCQNEISYSRTDMENTSYLHVAPGPRPSALKHSASTCRQEYGLNYSRSLCCSPLGIQGLGSSGGRPNSIASNSGTGAKCKGMNSMGTCLIELALSACGQSTAL